MKYTILGFQQEKLIENDLNVEDALILRMIKDMYSTSSMEFITEEHNKYMWINYTYFIEQIPIVGSKRNLMRKIEKYSSNNLIIRLLKHSKNGKKGNYSYIAPTIELDKLQEYDLMTNCHNPYDKNGITLETNCHNKDSSIKDSSIERKNSNKNTYDSIINEFTTNKELRESLLEFIKMRKLNKKTLTDRALKNIISSLKKLSSDEKTQIDIVNQSIERCWTGVFPLKNEQNGATNQPENSYSHLKRL